MKPTKIEPIILPNSEYEKIKAMFDIEQIYLILDTLPKRNPNYKALRKRLKERYGITYVRK